MQKTSTINQNMYPEWTDNLLNKNVHFKGGTENDKKAFLKQFDKLNQLNIKLLDNNKISELKHEENAQLIENARCEFLELEPKQF